MNANRMQNALFAVGIGVAFGILMIAALHLYDRALRGPVPVHPS